jgi:hypothetical protein
MIKMTKREWLASLGLAIAGARGKFSRDAIAALKAEEERCAKEDIPLPWTEIVKPESKGKRGRKKQIKSGLTAYEKAHGVEEDSSTVNTLTRAEIVSAPIRREETTAWVNDNGTLIAIQYCGGCGRTISRCSHDVPIAPKWLGGGLAMLIKPVMTNV